MANWRLALKEAMGHTNTINFVVDGMNVLDPTQRQDVKNNPDSTNAHWEMDQIVKLGLLGKLHLWVNGQELTGQDRSRWIREWRRLRGI
jgi:hypothetical protein